MVWPVLLFGVGAAAYGVKSLLETPAVDNVVASATGQQPTHASGKGGFGALETVQVVTVAGVGLGAMALIYQLLKRTG